MRALRGEARGRALALGLLVCTLLAGVVLVAAPLALAHRYYDGKLADLKDRLERYQRLAATRAELRQRLEQMRAMDGERFYLKSAAPARAAGEIQELEKSLIEANGGRLASMQILPYSDEGAYRRIAVNAQMLGNIATVQNVLRALEMHEPFLFIDNLNVRSLATGGGKAAPEARLVVQFDLIGYAIRR